jgi:hypothetical protein
MSRADRPRQHERPSSHTPLKPTCIGHSPPSSTQLEMSVAVSVQLGSVHLAGSLSTRRHKVHCALTWNCSCEARQLYNQECVLASVSLKVFFLWSASSVVSAQVQPQELMQWLPKLSQLRYLDVSGLSLHDSQVRPDWSALRHCPNLETLRLQFVYIRRSAWLNLFGGARFVKLRQLRISGDDAGERLCPPMPAQGLQVTRLLVVGAVCSVGRCCTHSKQWLGQG